MDPVVRCRLAAALVLMAAAVGCASGGRGRGSVRLGPDQTLPAIELATLDGSRAPLVGGAPVNVVLYVRPDVTVSVGALATLERLQVAAGSALHAVAVVPARADPDAVRAMLRKSGASIRVLVDEGDELAAWHQISALPVAATADARGRLVACDVYTRKGFADTLEERLASVLAGPRPRAASVAALPEGR
jgi:hypothetical protein